jgi:hypothetical protein
MTHVYPWLAALGLAALASTALLQRRARTLRPSVELYDWT